MHSHTTTSCTKHNQLPHYTIVVADQFERIKPTNTSDQSTQTTHMHSMMYTQHQSPHIHNTSDYSIPLSTIKHISKTTINTLSFQLIIKFLKSIEVVVVENINLTVHAVIQ